MNRHATAVECVLSLAAQILPPDRVVIADNCSEDGTSKILKELENLPFVLTVIDMQENAGNAGGVEQAMELSFSEGADAVWILDDDSWPRPEALKAMLAEGFDPRIVSHPIQLDPTSGQFTWPLQIQKDGAWILANSTEELPIGKQIPSRGVWTGALISKEIRNDIGPVLGVLFIRGEDEEYPWRVEKAGFSFQASVNAILDHPGPLNMRKWSMFGKSFFFEQGLVDWKFYYKTRNMVWLKKRQSGAIKAIITGLAYASATILLDGISRLPLAWKAASDGWKGQLGKAPNSLKF